MKPATNSAQTHVQNARARNGQVQNLHFNQKDLTLNCFKYTCCCDVYKVNKQTTTTISKDYIR